MAGIKPHINQLLNEHTQCGYDRGMAPIRTRIARLIDPRLIRAEAPAPVGRPTGARPTRRDAASSWLTGGRTEIGTGIDAIHSSGLAFQIMATRARKIDPGSFELVRVDNPDRHYSNKALADAELYDRPHIADKTWHHVNPFMSLTDLLVLWSMYWDMVGEMALLPTFNKLGIPAEIWPINPLRMTPIPHPTEYLEGWLFRAPADGIEYKMTPEQVWFDRFPDPNSEYRGIGALTGARAHLAASNLTAQWQRNLLKNRAGAEIVVTTSESLNDKEYDRLVAEIARNTGPESAGGAILMEKGTANVVSFNPREMQLTETVGAINEEIRMAWGVSKTLLGANEDVNRATADTARDLEAESHTIPKLKRITNWLNNTYLPAFGPLRGPVAYRFIDPSPAQPEIDAIDRDSRVALFQAYVDRGADPTEAATVAGLPLVEFSKPVIVQDTSMDKTGDDNEDDQEDNNNNQDDTDDDEPEASLIPVWAQTENEPEIPEDMRKVDEDWTRIVDDLISKFGGVYAVWLAWVLGELKPRLENGEVIADIRLPDEMVSKLTGLVADSEERMATTAAERAADEINELTESDDAEPDSWLESIAEDVAILSAGAFVGSLIGEAMRLRRPGIRASDVVSQVEGFALQHKNVAIKDRFREAMTRAQNRARIATIDAAVKLGLVEFEATEILDGATCGPCKRVDKVRFADRAAALEAYPSGGYKDCDGRSRCRGTVRPVRKA